MKPTQPVLVQKLEDEYDLPDGRSPKTPAVTSQVLVRGNANGTACNSEATVYCSGTATFMLRMQWLSLGIHNATRRVRHISVLRLVQIKALQT